VAPMLRRRALAGLLAACGLGLAGGAGAASLAPLTVCMSGDNAPLSYQVKGEAKGLDLRIAQAVAADLGRALVVRHFESDYEKESMLTHEVNALLSSGLCDAASGFPLLASDLGPASRPTSRTPDYPGAKRQRDRPFVALGTLVPSRAYQAVMLGVVLRDGDLPLTGLNDLGQRKLGSISGTLANAAAMGWHDGALRPQLVSFSQRQDPLDELAKPSGSRIDAAFVPLALFDGWKLSHPDKPLVAASYRRPIGVNLGFVTLSPALEVRAALDRVIGAALADGRLARWAAEEGVNWAAPMAPEVSPGPTIADLTAG
jgi:ABC-type amino acid transport substrate-binding protein